MRVANPLALPLYSCMMQDQNPIPPPGFVHHKPLFERMAGPQWKLFFFANLIALLPFSAGLLLLWVPYQLYLVIGAPLALLPDLQLAPFTSITGGVLIFIASMLLHEWLHGLALQN